MRDKRPVSYSKTEWIRGIQYEDINGSGRLFGGRLMEWMDMVAGVAAVRHCNQMVTTAAVDNLTFKRGAFINEILVIIATVTYVGRTSIEVRCDVYIEDVETGMRHPINRAYFTEVAVDKEGHPTEIKYDLDVASETEKAEYEGAKKRIAMRKERRKEGF